MNEKNNYEESGSNQQTIGGVLEALQAYPGEARIQFANGVFLDGSFDSYRGSYEDVALGYERKDCGFNTVDAFKRLLSNVLDSGYMMGFKGGEFPITEDTLVWVGKYGTSSESARITGVLMDSEQADGRVMVVTSSN